MKKLIVVFLSICLALGSCVGTFAAAPSKSAAPKAVLKMSEKDKQEKLRKLRADYFKLLPEWQSLMDEGNRIAGQKSRLIRFALVLKEIETELKRILGFRVNCFKETLKKISAEIRNLDNALAPVNEKLNKVSAKMNGIRAKIRELGEDPSRILA